MTALRLSIRVFLEQVDTAFDIYEHPKTRFVAGFIGESNIFDAVVISQDGDTVTVGTEVGKAQYPVLPVNWQREVPFRYRFVRKICCTRESG